MADTAQTIIEQALVQINAMQYGQTPPSLQLDLGLKLLNRLVNAMSAQKSFLYSIQSYQFPFVANQSIYAVGPTGDWVCQRPAGPEPGRGINFVNVLLDTPTPGCKIPVEIIRADQWFNIQVLNINSNYPTRVYNDGQYPNANLNFWPVPTTVYTVELVMHQQITEFPSLGTDFGAPQGYPDAMIDMLAEKLYGLVPAQNGTPVDASMIAERARRGRVLAKLNNQASPIMQNDAPRGNGNHDRMGYFDWRNGNMS